MLVLQVISLNDINKHSQQQILNKWKIKEKKERKLIVAPSTSSHTRLSHAVN